METVYDPNSFNNLPLIRQAAARFTDINGEHVVSTTFRDLFVRHKMDRTFGLALLHRHFELDVDERLVEYRGTSVPWAVNQLAAHIKPSSWLISAMGTVHPYEFYHSLSDEGPTLDLGNPHQQAFLAEFAEVLSQHNAQGLFGLCRYPGDDFKGRIEITQGRSNINLIPEDVSPHPSSERS